MTAWIGLTGGIGSGKSQVAAEFAGFCIPLIDTDAISRSLTAENGEALSAIYEAFGAEVFETPATLEPSCLTRTCIQQCLSEKSVGTHYAAADSIAQPATNGTIQPVGFRHY